MGNGADTPKEDRTMWIVEINHQPDGSFGAEHRTFAGYYNGDPFSNVPETIDINSAAKYATEDDASFAASEYASARTSLNCHAGHGYYGTPIKI